jgi:hypothetical protein
MELTNPLKGLLFLVLAAVNILQSSCTLDWGAEQCREVGFTPNLQCSTCKELGQFGLDKLSGSCNSCCQDKEEQEGKGTYPFAELHVCGWKLGSFPQIQAFVKSDRPKQFAGLSVRYMRGANPSIKLLDENRSVVETLNIEKWNTDSVEEFLKERLQN